MGSAISDAVTQNNTAITTTPVQSPSLSAQIISQSKTGNAVTIGLKLTNVGTGSAQYISIKQISVRALGGTGAATYVSPAIPIGIGSLGVGQSTTVTFTINVPPTVAKVSITEQGSVQDAAGNLYNFALEQVVFPGTSSLE